MASRFGQKRVGRSSEYSGNTVTFYRQYTHLSKDLTSSNELSHSASWWDERGEHTEQGDSLKEHLKAMDEHAARLQDMLRCERTKSTRLQLRCNQLEAELRLREQLTSRLKERVAQQTDRHREKGPSIEVLNLPPGGRGKKEQLIKSFRSTAKREEAALRLMLERREAELREAMKLRHSLTTLLHSLRVDMEHTLSNVVEVQTEDKGLDQAERALGDHVTGGVVQSWRQVQRRLADVPSGGHSGVDTDHDKLLAGLETELKGSQQLVRLQQQLLQDSLASPATSELADSYFLEEWERLQVRSAELDHQRRTFERERRSFTDAAIRLSHERREFEQKKAALLKQHYLCDSPLSGKGAPRSNTARRSAALDFSSFGPSGMSDCLPITPPSTKSGSATLSVSHQGRFGVHTPSTPELYSALNLSYNCSRALDDAPETWDSRVDGMLHTPQASHLDWSF
uniref:afadin- and alpha-actinin-binding protein isoform X2 n=1 Tax=Gasterosteus aculeatus aculeatus TaxID=481459 RepID=UPI001A99C356|nr:afadin- and alpha-actinin-binding protein isoform X2 [Gasterosteus aculeatus aculeatus]